jgi:hypothetical protein
MLRVMFTLVVAMQSTLIQSFAMLSVVMLNVIMLNVGLMSLFSFFNRVSRFIVMLSVMLW